MKQTAAWVLTGLPGASVLHAQQAQYGAVSDYALISGDVVHRVYLQEQGDDHGGFAMDEE